MNFDMAAWILGAGFVLLALGSEGLVRGGVMLKRALGISPVVIGLFVLSLGTSSPTLAVAAKAASSNLPDLALGVILGTTLINLLLILGLGALIRPMPSAPKVVLRDGGALLIASALFVALAHLGEVGRREGVGLIGLFLAYAVGAIVSDWRRSTEHSIACAEAERRSTGEYPTLGGGLFVIVVGAICLLLGAHFMVSSASPISHILNIPIGTAAVAVISLAVSVPLLIATLVAAARGHTQIVVGHLMIASVFNLTGALGTAALVRPLRFSPAFASLDVFVLLGATALLIPLLASNWRLTRPKAALLILAYVGYAVYLAWHLGLLPIGASGPA